MVSDFINQTIFWEYRVEQFDPDEGPDFFVKQVFNRYRAHWTKAIPSLMAYYGAERVEALLRAEEWLTSHGIATARHYFPHLRKRDFKATARINRRKRRLAKAGEFYGHL